MEKFMGILLVMLKLLGYEEYMLYMLPINGFHRYFTPYIEIPSVGLPIKIKINSASKKLFCSRFFSNIIIIFKSLRS